MARSVYTVLHQRGTPEKTGLLKRKILSQREGGKKWLLLQSLLVSKDVEDDADHQHKTTFAYYLCVWGGRKPL